MKIFEHTETISERPGAVWFDVTDNVVLVSVRGGFGGISSIKITTNELAELHAALGKFVNAPAPQAEVEKPTKTKKAE